MNKGIFLLLVALASQVACVTFTVGAAQEECFLEDLKQGSAALVMFQVLEGGFLDIDVMVNLLR